MNDNENVDYGIDAGFNFKIPKKVFDMKKKLVKNWDCPIPNSECGNYPVCLDCIDNPKNKK